MLRSALVALTLLPAAAAAAPPPGPAAEVAMELDLSWEPSLTPDERRELLQRPRFAAGEPMMVGGLVAAGAGIAMLVSGLATKSPGLTAAGAVTWPVGATVHFVGLGLFLSETRPYFRDLAAGDAPGLAP
jgi:hypothetical protein